MLAMNNYYFNIVYLSLLIQISLFKRVTVYRNLSVICNLVQISLYESGAPNIYYCNYATQFYNIGFFNFTILYSQKIVVIDTKKFLIGMKTLNSI